MSDIETGVAALVCATTYRPCCSSFENPETQWYFPNGSRVPNNPNLPYQRTRVRELGTVILSRNSESTTTGHFRCDIPDATGVTQSLYVGIYTCATGEFCTLWEWTHVCIVLPFNCNPNLMVWYSTCQMTLIWVYLCVAYMKAYWVFVSSCGYVSPFSHKLQSTTPRYPLLEVMFRLHVRIHILGVFTLQTSHKCPCNQIHGCNCTHTLTRFQSCFANDHPSVLKKAFTAAKMKVLEGDRTVQIRSELTHPRAFYS